MFPSHDTQTKEFIQDLEINEQYGINLPFTTTIKPLAKKDGFAVCFNGTKWKYIEDFRNTVVYDKETKQESKIDYLGKIKDDVTISKPEQFDKWDNKTNSWVEDWEAKEKHENSVKKLEKEERLSKIVVTTQNGNTFDGNLEARTNMTSAIMAAEVLGKTEEVWKLADNSQKTIELSELKEALALSIQEVGNIVKDY